MTPRSIAHAIRARFSGPRLRLSTPREGGRAMVFDEPGDTPELGELFSPPRNRAEEDPSGFAYTRPPARFIDDPNEAGFRSGLLRAAREGYDYFAVSRLGRASQLERIAELYTHPVREGWEARTADDAWRPFEDVPEDDPNYSSADRNWRVAPPLNRDEGGFVRITLQDERGDPVEYAALRLHPILRERLLREGVRVTGPDADVLTPSLRSMDTSAWSARSTDTGLTRRQPPWAPHHGYVSAVREAAEKLPERIFSQPPRAVLNLLKKQRNVRREEITFLRLWETYGDRSEPISRLELLDHIDQNMLRIKKRTNEFDPVRPSRRYKYGGTRAFDGPRVQGYGRYFEDRLQFPRQTKAGEEIAASHFRGSHWFEDGVFGSIRGSVRDVPGYGRGVLGEELQSDFFQGATGRGDDATGRRPKVSATEFLQWKRRRNEYYAVISRTRRSVDDLMRLRENIDSAPREGFPQPDLPKDSEGKTMRGGIHLLDRVMHGDIAFLKSVANWIAEQRQMDVVSIAPYRQIFNDIERTPEFFTADAERRFAKTESNYTPDSPLWERWPHALVKQLIVRAARENADWVAIPTRELNDRIQYNSSASAGWFYDQTLRPIMERLGREYGGMDVSVERVRLPLPPTNKTAPVWMMRLTPEMRGAISKGVPLFAAQRPRIDAQPTPDGRDGLRAKPITPEQRAAVERALPGLVRFVDDASELPFARGVPGNVLALYDPGTTTAYFIASRIRPPQLNRLVLHEIGVHHGLADMMGPRRYDALIAKVQRQVAEAEARAGTGAEQDGDAALLGAYEAAQANAADLRHLWEEVLAYWADGAPEPTGEMATIWREILRAVRAFIVQFLPELAGDMSEDDMRTLALASLRRAQTQAQRGQARAPLPLTNGELLAARSWDDSAPTDKRTSGWAIRGRSDAPPAAPEFGTPEWAAAASEARAKQARGERLTPIERWVLDNEVDAGDEPPMAAAERPGHAEAARTFGSDEEIEDLLRVAENATSFEEIYGHPVMQRVEENARDTPSTMTPEEAAAGAFADRAYDINGQPASFGQAMAYLAARYVEWAGPEVRKERRAVVVLGHPGAGKSSLINAMARSRGAAVLDADIAKEIVPGYAGGANTQSTHVESSALRNRLLQAFVENGANTVVEAVGDDPSGLSRHVQPLLDAGYAVDFVLVDVDPVEAARRQVRRWAENGRYINPSYATRVAGKPRPTFDALVESGFINSFMVIDGHAPKGQTRITARQGADDLAEALQGGGPSSDLRPGEPVQSAGDERGDGQGAGDEPSEGPGAGPQIRAADLNPQPTDLRAAELIAGQALGGAGALLVGLTLAPFLGAAAREDNSPLGRRRRNEQETAAMGDSYDLYPVVESAPELTDQDIAAAGTPWAPPAESQGYAVNPATGRPLFAPAGAPSGEGGERQFAESFARRQIVRSMQDLMGDEPDLDGVAADLVDTGSGLIMWGVFPDAERIGVTAPVDDWTDPSAWSERLDSLDLPGDLERPFERLVRAMAPRMRRDREGAVRRDFVRRVGDLFREAGVEALAIRRQGGAYDWLVFDAAGLAHETDGEPWAPPGGLDTIDDDVRWLGHALGLGGQVYLWPGSAIEPPAGMENMGDPPGAPLRVRPGEPADIRPN